MSLIDIIPGDRHSKKPTPTKAEAAAGTPPSDWHAHLDALFPKRAMLTPQEVAKALEMNPRTVVRLFSGKDKTRPWLAGIKFSAGAGQRAVRRIPRDAAILFYAQTANYTPEDLVRAIVEVLSHRTLKDLVTIQQHLTALIRRKQS